MTITQLVVYTGEEQAAIMRQALMKQAYDKIVERTKPTEKPAPPDVGVLLAENEKLKADVAQLELFFRDIVHRCRELEADNELLRKELRQYL